MSASSGIGVSAELASAFASAASAEDSTRFLKISIQNESLAHDLSIPKKGSLDEDLLQLQDVLDDNTPAYILSKLDDPPSEWLAIFYVPDTAKVRDKMLYASTRASLTKSLGSTSFSDSIFATSKSDLTPDAYTAHKKHLAAPQPLSSREQEMADIRAAERQGESTYQGMRGRASHVGTGVGLNWSEPVESALSALGSEDTTQLAIITIEGASETLKLDSTHTCTVSEVGKLLPTSDPSYAVLGWSHSYGGAPVREIVFIYSCPSSSPIKHRMIYSSGSSSVYTGLKSLLSSASCRVASRKIETSDPSEVDENFLLSELGLNEQSSNLATNIQHNALNEKKPFARPKGPGRKR